MQTPAALPPLTPGQLKIFAAMMRYFTVGLDREADSLGQQCAGAGCKANATSEQFYEYGGYFFCEACAALMSENS